ncbi:NDMA-dependent alcohol dehydrogenase [Pseudonocardia sp. WMMC193]|uniref:NDMA-dependent alcohol dehydrogenase n=1 Tax=Pseudonocardia sp. WMMC193 TaxID=2911965 RepID=UPI001F02423D|nr:NDMA-dependent alcohol dehydrogenase [Pseudonocardia sp. WMMC193]MCF7550782.1 NDMA-dependent alcohol dehydrogenase [Pseudonocardia sp. WMMC193]
MKTRASIIRTSPGKFETAEVDLDGPRAGEVTVKLAASGLCHSDDHLQTADMKVPVMPICGGHEGAGVVVEVGPEVHHLKEGDHVVFAFIPGCGRCRFCARGMANLCDLGYNMLWGSRLDDRRSFRMSLDGEPVSQMAGISTFSEYSTVDVRSCVKIPDDIPLTTACLTGCGVGTGWGSAVNSAEVRPGHTVIVMGVGGIGINAVQGAAHAGAQNLIAVDPVAFKREVARSAGATHVAESMAEATELARAMTNGQGADSAIVTVGRTTGAHLAEAFAAIRKGGTLVATGIGDSREVGVPVPIAELIMYQKRIQGSLYGACSPSVDIPLQLELYRSGKLMLDELITATYTLDEVTKGYEDMHAGKNIRGVVVFD